MGDDQKKIKMEDDQKNQNGRRTKEIKMEDGKKMEDDQKKSKWKMTKKIQDGGRYKKNQIGK